jgi:aminopeptidase N
MELVHFQTTPPMSTYLVAIYVGDFVANVNNSAVKVYARADSVNQTKYVGSEAQKHLDVLSKYTGIKYMLPKMDLLAIPDFKSGAMENWGMNTYR